MDTIISKLLIVLGICSILLFSITSCKSDRLKKNKVVEVKPVDTTITVSNAVFPEFFDSTEIYKFIDQFQEFDTVKQHILNFYKQRNFQYAWYDNNGFAAHTGAFINEMIDDLQASPDSARVRRDLDKLTNQVYWGTTDTIENQPNVSNDLLLTAMYFKHNLRMEASMPESEIRDLGWYIPKKKINLETALANLVKDTVKYAMHPMYYKLKKKIPTLTLIQSAYDGAPIQAVLKKPIPLNGSSDVLPEIWHKLYLLKDLAVDDTSKVYSPDKLKAVVNFRKRHGMKPDTAIGNDLIKELNVPIKERIKTIYVNMERLRWLPAEMFPEYLLVNIPEYKVHAFRKDSLLWSMRVVVGATNTKTVIFQDELSQVVFSPYWYPPRSILRKEIFPGLKRNPSGYLAKHDMQIVDANRNPISSGSIDWSSYNASNFPYTVRQKPGLKNALGKVKFLFPNEHSIYMHDTPSKKYFDATDRAFSHGCIRVAEPQRLAEYVLKANPEWTPEKIKAAMENGKEQYVKIKEPIPVLIGYWTSWVDGIDNLNFRQDIYKNDESMAEKLFK